MRPGRPELEIAVTSAEDARIARESGADRVELCQALEVGGVGPTAAQIERAVASGVPVHVLIRPRPGDFVYSCSEMSAMERDAADAMSRGAAGVVIGALTSEGVVDTDALVRLVAAAGIGAVVTLHRAIDRAADPVREIERLHGVGVHRVLTSGARPTVAGGLASGVLERMVQVSGELQIMAGGGAVLSDLPALRGIGVEAVHLSASRPAVDAVPDPLAPAAAPHRRADAGMIAAFRASLDGPSS